MQDDRFKEKTTAYIERLVDSSSALRTMYKYDPEFEDIPADRSLDLLNEKQNTPIKGIVCKYPGQALMLLSYTCAANCRYCERQDRVGVGLDSLGRLSDEDIDAATTFLAQRPDIFEVIFSGGDPLTHPKGLLRAAESLAELEHISMLRIHTRFPMQMPEKVDMALMEKLVNLVPAFYFSLHIDHPDELTPECIQVIHGLRKLGFVMLCQTVFLKGVNDSADVLERLFSKLAELGVRPYYIYHCQAIPTTTRFVMPLKDEIDIMTTLRERLSGLAFPQHVIDMQRTTGKVVVPSGHWIVDLSNVRDFEGSTMDFTIEGV